MDVTPVVLQFFKVFLYLLPILVIVAFLKTPLFKGWFGEAVANLLAFLILDKKTYHLIKNVTIPAENGTTQIDHIIVSIYGVFVVETKNMKGWIFGSQAQKTWTQKIFKHTNKFQNPLHQNYKHVKTLQSILGLEENQIHSIVVFVGDSTFKTEMPENVTHGIGYIRYIKSKREQVLSSSEVLEIKNKIETGRLVRSFRTNKEHIANVKNIVREKENKKTLES